MEADDLPEFAKALTALAECFGEPLSVARIEAYFSALDDLPLANVQEALAGAMRTKTFFPKPAELRDLAGCQGPDVGEAYAELSVALRRYYWKAPAVSPAVDMIVQRMGGWRTVAMMSEEDQWRRFQKLWEPVRVACAARGLFLPEPSGPDLRLLVGKIGNLPLKT